MTRRDLTAHPAALIGLLLLYWLTRLHKIETLAFFLDEAAHVDWARLVWQLQPFHAASDGKLLNIWWIAVFWPLNAGVWVSRTSDILVTTVGLACALAFARRAFSIRTAFIVGLLYIFLPLAFFFERMALPDAFSAAFVAGAVWAAGRSVATKSGGRGALGGAALGGAALAAAILGKVPNLVFLCLPLLAVLTLVPFKDWRRGAWLAGVMYTGCALTLGPFVVGLKYIGHSDLGFDLLTSKTEGSLSELPGRLWSFASVGAAYMPFPMWPLILLGVAVALWPGKAHGQRSTWFVSGVLLITLGALLSRASYAEARYLAVYVPLLVILAGVGLARLTAQWWPIGTAVGLIVLLGAGANFIQQGWENASALPLPDSDRWQYLTGWPSGYGFREIAAEMIASDQPLQLVTLELSERQRLDVYLLGHTQSVTAQEYKSGRSWAGSVLLVDLPINDEAVKKLPLTLTEIGRYPRPGGESAVVVYLVSSP